MVNTITADLVPLRERMKYMAIIMTFFTLGSFIGPIIGGAIVLCVSWRWVFYINLPIVGVALVLALCFLIDEKGEYSKELLVYTFWGTSFSYTQSSHPHPIDMGRYYLPTEFMGHLSPPHHRLFHPHPFRPPSNICCT